MKEIRRFISGAVARKDRPVPLKTLLGPGERIALARRIEHPDGSVTTEPVTVGKRPVLVHDVYGVIPKGHPSFMTYSRTPSEE